MEHIVVMVDAFSKYTFLKAVPNTATKHTIRALEELSSWVGMPETLISDRGTSFTSREFTKFCTDHAMRHVLNAVRTPRANGQVERANRTLLSMLRPLTTNTKKWDEGLRQIQWSMNAAKNATTRCSPHDLLLGYKPRDILANKLVLVLQDIGEPEDVEKLDRHEKLQKDRERAVANIAATREKAKLRFDRQHAKPTMFRKGDLVLVKHEAPSTGTSRKLEPLFKGPFVVSEVLGNDRYVVEDLPGAQRTQRHYRSVFASEAMKKWCVLLDDEPLKDEDIDEVADRADGRM